MSNLINNQCDGCNRGLAFKKESNIHIDEYGLSYMACTATLYKQAEEHRRHLETCTKPIEKCSTCFRHMVHEMLLIQTGKGNRASDNLTIKSKKAG